MRSTGPARKRCARRCMPMPKPGSRKPLSLQGRGTAVAKRRQGEGLMDSGPHRPHPPIAEAMGPPLSPAGRGTFPLDPASDFPAIPEGWSYLDTAATAQKPKAVIDAIALGYSETYATVHRGVYKRSSDMTLAFEAARRRVASFIGAPSPDEIVFVRGATEGINLVAQSWGSNLKPG